MLKKLLSWTCLAVLLCACIAFSSLAEPASDTGDYDFQYVTAEGAVGYGMLNNANAWDVDKVPAGSKVTLLRDVTASNGCCLTLENQLTVDGNGHTLTGFSIRVTELGDSSSTLLFQNIRFVHSSEGNPEIRICDIYSDNKVTFEDCTFSIHVTKQITIMFRHGGELTFRRCQATVTSDVDLSRCTLFLSHTNSGGPLYAYDSTFDITQAGGMRPGRVAGYNGTFYGTYAEAFAQVPAEGGTVTLLTSYQFGLQEVSYLQAVLSCTQAKGPVVFDGQGQTIIGTEQLYKAVLQVNSDITVKNLNVVQNGSPVTTEIAAGVTATLENCTVSSAVALATGVVNNYGTLILNNGARILSEKALTIKMQKNSALIINDGAVLSSGASAINVNPGSGSKTDVTINGGTITAAQEIWYGFYDVATLTVNGGTLTTTSTSVPPFYTNGSADPKIYLYGGHFTAPCGKICDVQSTVRDLGGTIVLNGKTILKAPGAEDLKTMGAALYLPTNATQENSGIRFETRLSKAWIDELIASGATITTGTLLAPKALVEKLGGLTLEALNGKGLHIENDGWNNAATATADGYYRYFGNMIQLSLKSLTGEIAGVGYVTVEVEGLGTVTYYGMVQSGVVRSLAEATVGANDAQNAVLAYFRGNAE